METSMVDANMSAPQQRSPLQVPAVSPFCSSAASQEDMGCSEIPYAKDAAFGEDTPRVVGVKDQLSKVKLEIYFVGSIDNIDIPQAVANSKGACVEWTKAKLTTYERKRYKIALGVGMVVVARAINRTPGGLEAWKQTTRKQRIDYFRQCMRPIAFGVADDFFHNELTPVGIESIYSKPDEEICKKLRMWDEWRISRLCDAVYDHAFRHAKGSSAKKIDSSINQVWRSTGNGDHVKNEIQLPDSTEGLPVVPLEHYGLRRRAPEIIDPTSASVGIEAFEGLDS
ncbi:uncharacterized protein LTR77_000132 [Saxophila tyrrhenica]|uniref:Uncharacterized protein n=1 Tax=Saxophila tyrrhenica TaxID=1690608 RepID=A0AAV9PMQ7_9PEZI|nr:hypothetical protein LTR77_000132 [Saxophila tyrrhenica]